MGIDIEKRSSTEAKMIITENSHRVFKYFEMMSFIPTRKTVYFNLPRSRGVIKQTIRINIKMSS